jgi:hypothetical protein
MNHQGGLKEEGSKVITEVLSGGIKGNMANLELWEGEYF